MVAGEFLLQLYCKWGIIGIVNRSYTMNKVTITRPAHKLLLITALAIAICLGIGTYQVATAFPHGCQKFDTGTSYAGYHCGSETRYVPQQ